MSRLYGRSLDVYSVSKHLVDNKPEKHKREKDKTTWEEVTECPSLIEDYLPSSAVKIIESKPIRVVGSPFVVKEGSLFVEGEDPTLLFPRWTPIDEYKRELVYFLGTVLANENCDKMPNDNSIPCEFSSVLSLLLEYLYLKEQGKEDSFSPKHLKELLYNAKKYIISYDNYHKNLLDKRAYDMFSDGGYQDLGELDSYYDKQEKDILKATLQCLVPYSSMDATLQIIERYKDKAEIKELIDMLVQNPNNDRQKALNDLGIETYGYNSLKKEIDRKRGR